MVMITTVQQHILQQQTEITGKEASGTFSWLLSGITLAAKMIESKIRAAGLTDIYGAFGQENVQGEQQQKLDVYANQALLHCLGLRDSVAALVSEEDAEPVTFNRDPETGKYIIIFDPLDGSSNIDVNVNVGTIFSVLRRLPPGARHPRRKPAAARHPPGRRRLRRLRSIHRARLHHRQRRPQLHPRQLDRRLRPLWRAPPHARAGSLLQRQRGQRLPAGPSPIAPSSTPSAPVASAASTARATSARSSPTSTAPCSKAASSSTPRRPRLRKANSASSTRPTPSPSSPSRPAASPPPARRASSISAPKASTSARPSASAAAAKWKPSRRPSAPPRRSHDRPRSSHDSFSGDHHRLLYHPSLPRRRRRPP